MSVEFHLFTDTKEILPGHNHNVIRTFRSILAERDVTVHTDSAVTEVQPDLLRTEAGLEFAADEILWVTAAEAPSWPAEAGLDVDAKGFVKVSDTLQSVSHPEVFAAGDVATMVNHHRPKSGVFAVRQGKPLARNLRRVLLDLVPRPFAPQKRFLSLITTGDQYAVASRGRWSVKGRTVWAWKNWIDRRFMDKYNVLPDMKNEMRPEVPAGLADSDAIKEISAIAMRCGGCGAKVGASVLGRAIAELKPVQRDDVLIGLHEPDDAAVVTVQPGKAVVQTIDSFRAMVDDPYVFGKIAANHSLGDIYAMGGEPQTALAVATIPFGMETKTEDSLSQMMAGAIEVLDDAGAALVGGHTSEGSELSLGFSINGLIDLDQVMRKGGLIPGDVLLLTKPVGTGTLFAADMRYKAKGRWITTALDSMIQSNRAGAKCLLEHEAHACTDVTGFGLLGHLVEMIRASNVDVELDLSRIPFLDGAEDTVRAGILSSLQPQNVRLRRAIANLDEVSGDLRFPLLFDPQTSGGLLASVPVERSADCIEALRILGYAKATSIGHVRSQGNQLAPISIRL